MAGLRLIPAHAGNTTGAGHSRRSPPAHPRPRGEHGKIRDKALVDAGSSPPTRGTHLLATVPDRVFRLIPAHAGNTTGGTGRSGIRSAHPRPRGEHRVASTMHPRGNGSSPPTRGTPNSTRPRDHPHRLIPAHAGNTTERATSQVRASAHPRPRGEHAVKSVVQRGADGSSPPTRGTPPHPAEAPVMHRLIPAHAGNTTGCPTWSKTSPAHPRPRGEHIPGQGDPPGAIGSSPPTRGTRARPAPPPCRWSAHPRPRGEHAAIMAWPAEGPGSSPPTRGTLGADGQLRDVDRLIPAHAGNTPGGPARRAPRPAHPRPRGEHSRTSWATTPAGGSSPPTRGTPRGQVDAGAPARLIPAHAGNTRRTCGACTSPTAHPRPRGEHPSATAIPQCRLGSSPPTRGTPGDLQTEHLALRLIPAHAGNTARAHRESSAGSAHPRPRGEHSVTGTPKTSKIGSSPPTRGTPRWGRRRRGDRRLIPAHAGNTPSWPSTPTGKSAHPRPRGEHPRAPGRCRTSPGSSPPTRGTRCPSWRRRPARAAHPRPRGEHLRHPGARGRARGSSPPTRGTRRT